MSSAFDKARETVEDGRGVSLGSGRLAGGKPHFARGHGKARERVEDEQDVFALRGEVFSYAGCGQRGAHAQERRLVRGGDEDDGAAAAFGPQTLFEEFADFATTLANQANDDDFSVAVAGHHANERAFAHTRAAEDADALAAAHGEQAVDGTDARAERGADRDAVERLRSRTIERNSRAQSRTRTSVHGLAESVEHASDECVADFKLRHCAEALDRIAIADAVGGFDGHGEDIDSMKADDFDEMPGTGAVDDLAAFAYGAARAG